MTSRRDALAVGASSTTESGDAPNAAPSEDSLVRLTGTVKWFDATRGFGFLVSDGANGDILVREDDLSQDIFVHMETVRRGGLHDLLPDQRLRARIADGRKGPLAVEVEPD